MKRYKKILITGTSGFIGFHVANYFLEKNYKVFGIDNHNNYYDINLKKKRCKILMNNKNFSFLNIDINSKKIIKILKNIKPILIIHLAAQAGVRYSFNDPFKYIDYNIKGFLNILESMKANKLDKLIYASSSSVYGNVKKYPVKENFNFNPENFYGLTKVFNEQLIDVYIKNYKIKSFGLRFFTIYGKIGRPDMFIPKIINNLKNKKKIYLYNKGNHYRDFTYVKDACEIIFKLSKKIDKIKRNNIILNICAGNSVSIKKVVNIISKSLKIKPKLKYLKFQIGDMLKTHGSNKKLLNMIGSYKFTKIEQGLKKL